MSASHRFEDHTSEVELSLVADTLPEIFVQAALALAELILGGEPPAPPPDAPPIRVQITGADPAGLLVDWLNELIYRTEALGLVFTGIEVESVGPRNLVARLRGMSQAGLASEVKAATLHQAALEPFAAGYRGHVVLDV